MRTAKPFTLRTWPTPPTIGSFILMAVTGVLMSFDVVPGYLAFAHEWFSWFFIVGAGGRWWRDSRYRLNRIMPIAFFDRLGVPRLS